jgi:site-specific recombinase XerC
MSIPAFKHGIHQIDSSIDDAGEGTDKPVRYDPRAGISASTLYDQLKRFFVECFQALALTDKVGAARIVRASTHWLRHTFGSHAVAAHTPLEVVQSVLGHASLNSTTIYVKAERKRRFIEMSRFWDEQMVARDRRRAGVE